MRNNLARFKGTFKAGSFATSRYLKLISSPVCQDSSQLRTHEWGIFGDARYSAPQSPQFTD